MADGAIGAVTKVLRDLLAKGLGGTTVGVRPPDQMDVGGGVTAGLNLYLCQVERSGRWHNLPTPQSGRPGESPAPLAVVLRYLLSAFGEDDLSAQTALERALGLLADNARLRRDAIRLVVPGSALARQVEPVRVTLLPTESRDLFHLWSLFQTPYRTSVLVEVEVVLIEGQTLGESPPPVAVRNRVRRPDEGGDGRDDLGVPALLGLAPPFPTIASVVSADGQAERSFVLGERLVLRGHNLDRGDVVRFTPSPGPDSDAEDVFVGVAPADLSDTEASVVLAAAAGPWRAGSYRVATLPPPAADPLNVADFERESNPVAVDLAPRLTRVKVNAGPEVVDPGAGPIPPVAVSLGGAPAGDLELTVTVEPPVGPKQRAVLLLNGRPVAAEPPTAGVATATFKAGGVARGTYWLRLRVDGVESRLVDRTQSPPAYRGFRVEVT